MSESFLVLLAAGVMLAVLIPDAKDVTVDWMRLGGIIALTMAALSIFFYTRRAEAGAGKVWTIYLLMMGSILFFIAGVHLPIRAIGRPFALCAAVAGTVAGTMLMGRMNGIALVSCAGVAAMSGIC
jgi:RsiW-degrading membrane proteinase PrsW (M82 family)